ncbi:MAG TPA: 4'-phosphopantetheinyl transferase superfamily protein [Terriglobia bacterium]|nr:4'-phosphopantetheinyl transferase superfamily protein [Terriglobia bacterium]
MIVRPPAIFETLLNCETEVHLWPVWLSGDDETVMSCSSVLSPAERERAASFKFEELRRKYVLSRGILRALLSRYVLASPQELRFTVRANGKPALLGSVFDIRFNVSHSGEAAIFAITPGSEVGVDIEHIRHMTFLDIAEQFFCNEEKLSLISLPPRARKQGFFHCWTRKEACLKATGEGLTSPPTKFCVTLKPDEPAQVLHVEGDRERARRWVLHDISPAEGYAGALAYWGPRRPIRLFEFSTASELLDLLDGEDHGTQIAAFRGYGRVN